MTTNFDPWAGFRQSATGALVGGLVGAGANALAGGELTDITSTPLLAGAGLGAVAGGLDASPAFHRAMIHHGPGFLADRSRDILAREARDPTGAQVLAMSPEHLVEYAKRAPLPSVYAVIKAHTTLGVHPQHIMDAAKKIYNARAVYADSGLR